MKIQCSSCLFEGNFPDEKIPSGGVTVSCPKCKNKFKIEEKKKMTKWEYHLEDINDYRQLLQVDFGEDDDDDYDLSSLVEESIDYRLKILGQDGWELITATMLPTDSAASAFWRCVFKRPIEI